MVKWEYGILTVDTNKPGEMQRVMNEWGDDGLELVSATPTADDPTGLILIFKRPKE